MNFVRENIAPTCFVLVRNKIFCKIHEEYIIFTNTNIPYMPYFDTIYEPPRKPKC